MKKAILLFSVLTSTVFAATAPAESVEPEFTLESSLSLRDPFRRVALKDSKDFDQGGNIPILERFEIDKFKLVGIITGPKENKALLTSPDGKMHIVSEATIIGNRRGKIKRITPKSLRIEEKVVNLLGQEESIETVLEFKKENPRE